MKDINTRQKVLLAVFGIFFIYFLYDYGFLSFGGGVDGVKVENQQENVSGLSGHSLIDINKIRMYVAASRVSEMEFEDDWDRDPFFYADDETITTEAKKPEEKEPDIIFKLVGISWQGGYGFALIGEDILQENDVIEGYIVEKISSDYVILSKGDSTIKLTLND
ncbi:MAG: hypothetical protein HQ510_06045 [Candidatus Marinimicrobia bacterium]|nr:hypothetical protein [Candidatus Neomarinimicrobiota bacterium]